MIVAASKGHRLAGVLMLVAALAYLVPFVPRGWVPHDEGMLGQSADQVLRGKLPHVDYEDAYTGGLSWIHAALFRLSSVDLLNIRWLLFATAACATWLVYAIGRRYHGPLGAAFAAWVALAWSFPNYFAGVPSWWLLACSLACLWSVMRFVETRQWRFVVTAGVAAGLAITIKQTGAYLLVALVLSLIYGGGLSGALTRFSRLEQLGQWALAGSALIFASTILFPRLFQTEGLYLYVPAAACAVVLFLPRAHNRPAAGSPSPAAIACVAAAAAAVPVACLDVPYAIRSQMGDFLNGAIVLPQKRVAFASYPMPGVEAIVIAIPVLALVVLSLRLRSVTRVMFLRLLWAAAIVVPISALWNVVSYQLIWQSARAIVTLLPIAICWRLASGCVQQPEHRTVLFASASILSWTALNQFPFAAPIYFCYVTPLAVVGAIAAASVSPAVPPRTMLPWGAMLLLFAVLSPNRGFIQGLGLLHETRVFDTDLNLPRAHLKVGGNDAGMYQKVTFTILRRLHSGGQLIAGPDCPEVYFLAGLVNPSGALFDFLSRDSTRGDNGPTREADEIAQWSKGEVIVINYSPDFSPLPSEAVLAELRREFSQGETIGRFEVRWR